MYFYVYEAGTCSIIDESNKELCSTAIYLEIFKCSYISRTHQAQKVQCIRDFKVSSRGYNIQVCITMK